jgi:hypothetical protein
MPRARGGSADGRRKPRRETQAGALGPTQRSSRARPTRKRCERSNARINGCHPCPASSRCQGAPRSPDARATQTAGTDAVGTSYIQAAGSDVFTPTPSNACQTSSIEDPRGVTAQSRVPRPVKPCRRMQSRIPNRSLHIVVSDVLMKCPSAKTWAEAMVASRPPVWTISRAPAGLLRVTQPDPSGHDARIRTSARVSKTTGCPAIQLLSGASWRLARTSKPMPTASTAPTTTENHAPPDMRLNVLTLPSYYKPRLSLNSRKAAT